MKTVVIQIGNSDNKLSQVEWSQFVSFVREFLFNEVKVACSGIVSDFCLAFFGKQSNER
jgi:hypothetical protein